MLSQEIRQKFLDFFEKRGHKIIPSSPLISDDPTVLFTTAGMQQFKKYFLGQKSPFGNKVSSCQKCLRTSDIDNVGDISHLTFLEMLGNFSFGDYFKEEAIKLSFQFLTEICNLDKDRLWFTIFKGDSRISKDEESGKIWQKLGIDKNKIYPFGREDNFWGPTGEEGPCGPTTEIHYDLTGNPCSLGEKCLPNCQCGRFIEIWNLVFNEYYQDKNREFSLLEQKGVDTGMGLERLVAVIQNKPSVFETDIFELILKDLRKYTGLPCGDLKEKYTGQPCGDLRGERIVADHIKSVVFLGAEGIEPSNIGRGYTLRRILRRAIRYGRILGLPQNFLVSLSKKVIGIYEEVYPELKSEQDNILKVIKDEEEKFGKTLDSGLKFLQKNIESFELFNKTLIKEKDQQLPFKGGFAFYMYETYGFPPDLTLEELRKYPKVNKKINEKEYWDYFRKKLKKHQEVSRVGAEKKFGGVGIEELKTEEEKLKATKLHTATHLLQGALRIVLGEKVQQMGSNVNPDRLRFDFSFERKMSSEEIEKVELLVNQKIKADLEVKREEMLLKDALKSGVLAFFKEKYPEKVSVYTIGGNSSTSSEPPFSREICAGPHIQRTSELGEFKIKKEESSSAGVRRIKAILI